MGHVIVEVESLHIHAHVTADWHKYDTVIVEFYGGEIRSGNCDTSWVVYCVSYWCEANALCHGLIIIESIDVTNFLDKHSIFIFWVFSCMYKEKCVGTLVLFPALYKPI